MTAALASSILSVSNAAPVGSMTMTEMEAPMQRRDPSGKQPREYFPKSKDDMSLKLGKVKTRASTSGANEEEEQQQPFLRSQTSRLTSQSDQRRAETRGGGTATRGGGRSRGRGRGRAGPGVDTVSDSLGNLHVTVPKGHSGDYHAPVRHFDGI
ncbi:hypothetical protein CBS101457_002908 [Exobasidium rhododendri]|nr:hypothetical protein CBS101457_002908 [Exobasidium rhododendri]